MKTLYLVRHAKSSWEFDVIDHDRPLNERGLNDGPIVAEAVAKEHEKPQRILSSDATRAQTTAVFFAQAYDIPTAKIQLEHALYDFEGSSLIDVIKACDDSIDYLMVVGHNNAMTNVANTYGDQHIDNVPTAGFTAIEFDVEHWKDIDSGHTTGHITPKGLKK